MHSVPEDNSYLSKQCRPFTVDLHHLPNFHLHRYVLLTEPESESGSEVIKKQTCSTQLSINFILLINVKMPTMNSAEHEI